MVHKLLKKVSTYKIFLSITGISIFLSVLLYIVMTIIIGEPPFKGIIRAFIIPAIIAPLMCNLVLRVLIKLYLTEEALQESEIRYKSIVENSHDGILIVDDKYNFTYVNDEFCKIIGYSSDEIIGQDFRRFLDEASKQLVSENYMRRQRGQDVPSQYEFNVVRKNGEIRRVEIRSTVKHDLKKGAQTYAQILDITETRLAEEELQKSEKRYRDVFENTGTATVIIDKDKKISMANAEFEKLSGYSKEELEGKMSWTDFVLDEDLKRMETYHAERRKENSKVPTDYEFRFINKLGNIRQILNKANIISGTDNSVASLLDITDIIKAKNDLEESENRFRSITASARDAIIMMDGEGKVSYWNEAAERIFGYSSDDILGKELHTILAPQDIHAVYKVAFQKFHETGNGSVIGKTLELTGFSKDKIKIPIELSISALKLKNEWNAIGIVRDISKRKKLEDELRQAQKMESIGNLAGGIAHDFNNILFPIIGMSELLLANLSPKSLEYENVQQILKAGKRGRDLVKQILVFSRQTEQKMIPVRIQQILKEVLKLSRSSIPSDIEISQDIQSDCGLVMADLTQLHQVAMNLITNAFHAVEQTGGKISVQLKELVLKANDIEHIPMGIGPGKYVVLSVSDTGCGVDPTVIDKIFDPYYTTKEKGKGTGLGLSVVYGIVKDHGGKIFLKSELNKGTIFDVYLPLLEKATKWDKPFEKKYKYETGSESILLVDDEMMVAQLEKQMLEHLGYKVVEQFNSSDALKAFKANPHAFDLVITDMTMPNMTGDRFAKELMSIKPDIPVIICTGFSERINEEKAKSIGIKDFLMKPVRMSDLSKTVRKALNEAIGLA